jgi:lipid II:glycine glycyltransferase (peptidoglycan interpeptide bridge formation enzyme)
MVIMERKLFRVFSYSTVFFAARKDLELITDTLRTTQIARFFWTATKLEPRSRIIHRQVTATVGLDLRKAPDELWQSIAKNGRNEIRSAERLGDRVAFEHNGPFTRERFLAIYNQFARGKGGVAPLDDRRLRRFGEHADIFVAYLDGRPMCGHVCLLDPVDGRARLLYSASRRLEDQATSRLCGHLNRLLHWREIVGYRERGLTTYDLGGIREDPNDGIARFKTSFGGEIIKEYTYLCAGSPVVGAAAGYFRDALRRRTSSSTPQHERPRAESPSEAGEAV